MENKYKITTNDSLAKSICFKNGISCETVPSGDNGVFRVAIHKNDELIKIREIEFEYNKRQYALYESYRALSQIILNNGNG